MNNLLICIEERISQEIDQLLNQLEKGGIRKNEFTSKNSFLNKQS
ncbi:hypothetical protein J2S17_004864 [Cytobacillus purgationiresistens]|uniref:Fur-regulated basic protein FbpA n=1 Tax=Cytobacillus purgationiresistens TaxID=863449 RepID=A0ABU0APL7_9BACI|nr:hypothetical protein [Cytobacillus purgationiresistens]